MDFKYIFFDLDGTLTESHTGIINSICYSLDKLGVTGYDRSELYKFIGPPLTDCYKSVFGFSEEKSLKALYLYREYYTETGMFQNKVYDGIPQLLNSLKNNGKQLFVATSKPEEMAKEILEYFELSKYFTEIYGSTLDETRTDKASVIGYALQEAGIAERDKTAMVGDRKFDVTGAAKNGIKCIGVLYGYGTRKELCAAGAYRLADTVTDLQKLLG